MAENGYITVADGEKAKRSQLNVNPRPTGAHVFAAEYFAEEVRREVYERYGEKKLYEGGLSVRATLNPKLQVVAKKALTDGLVRYDEARGWRGATLDHGRWGSRSAR
jgi:penicillin-binding protein 1A